jgi:hypothetical protein
MLVVLLRRCQVGSCMFAGLCVAATTHAAEPAGGASLIGVEKVSNQTAPIVFVAAGLGLPEVVNAQLGLYLHPRISLEGVYGWVLFNHMAGLGLTTYLLGSTRGDAPPSHSLTLGGYVRSNIERPLLSDSAGEKLGTLGELGVGYAYHADSGFQVRSELVGLATFTRHAVEGGALVRFSAGWAFSFGQ